MNAPGIEENGELFKDEINGENGGSGVGVLSTIDGSGVMKDIAERSEIVELFNHVWYFLPRLTLFC